MSKRWLIQISLVATLSLLIAACGSAPPQPAEDSAAPESAQEEVSDAAPAEEPESAQEEASDAASAEEAAESEQAEEEAVAEAASAEGEPVYGGTITVGIPGDIATFDPPVQWGPQEESAIQLVYNGLYRFKYGTAEIEPEIAAEMPQVSDDGRVWTIKLREDVKFSNGEPLTAHDVKYSWGRMLDDETQGWAVTYYMAIDGASDAFSGATEGVEGITVIDDYTIQFELAEPIAYFDKLMAMQWSYILNQNHVEEVGEDIVTQPMGAGPYMLVEYEPGVQTVFEKNPNYFRDDEPYADRVVFELNVDPSVAALKIEQGEIDLYLERIPPQEFRQLKDDPSFKGGTFEKEWLNTFFLAVNTIQEGLEDKRVRQAIAHCLDREALIKAVPAGFAVPAHTMLPPGDELNFNADQPYYEYDPEKAKELLAEAGYADGFTFEAGTANYFPWDQFGQAVQGQLAQCGIDLKLSLLETAAWYENNASQENGIVFMHWPYEIPDPAYVLDGGFTEAAFFPDSCCNWTWFWTQNLEDMLASARVETDPVQRGELYHDIDELISYDQALWIPLWHPIEWYATSENLGGFQPPGAVHPRFVEPQYYWSKSGE